MRATALTEFGGPEVLTLTDLRGAVPHHTPLIPGWDVAGVVRAVGPAVTRFATGDEVLIP